MKSFIKNVPKPLFLITGNRGIGFPVAPACFKLVEDTTCYLLNEDGGNYILFEKGPSPIEGILAALENTTCVEEIVTPCYLALEEDGETTILSINGLDYFSCETEDSIFVEEFSPCYLALQEDGESILYLNDGEEYFLCDPFFIPAPTDWLVLEEDGVTYLLQNNFLDYFGV